MKANLNVAPPKMALSLTVCHAISDLSKSSDVTILPNGVI